MRILKPLLILISSFIAVGCQPSKPYESRANEVFPPVALRYAALFRMDQLPISATFFRDQWTVLMFASSSCGDECQHRLALLNAVKRAQTLLVIENVASHSRLRALKEKYPSVAISMGTTAASIDNFMRQFETESIPSEDRRNYIYLINPAFEFSYVLSVNGLKPGEIDKELQLLKRAFDEERET